MLGRLLGLGFVVLLVSLLSIGQMLHSLSQPLKLQGDTSVIVKKGESLNAVLQRLHDRGWLDELIPAKFYLRFTGRGHRIQAGEYTLQAGSSLLQLIERLESGAVLMRQMTLVEGWTAQQALHYVQAQTGVVSSLAAADLTAWVQRQVPELSLSSAEGLLFPDTYHYSFGVRDVDVLQQALDKTQQVLAEEWQQRRNGLPLRTPYEALILASIVEKETGLASERGMIASVFLNRLRRGMRLQTDPTVIYGLGERFAGNITRAHLLDDNPYNTYRIAGLPPTPISLPGREALRAVLQAPDSKALYFVAKGDGSSYFSSTLEEHNKAVRRYQIYQRRGDYRSAPSQ